MQTYRLDNDILCETCPKQVHSTTVCHDISRHVAVDFCTTCDYHFCALDYSDSDLLTTVKYV